MLTWPHHVTSHPSISLRAHTLSPEWGVTSESGLGLSPLNLTERFVRLKPSAPHPQLPLPPQTSLFCMLARMHRVISFYCFFCLFVVFYSSRNCDNKELHSLKDSSGCNRPHSLCSVPFLPLAVHDLSPVDLCRLNLTPKTRTQPKLSSPYNHQIAPIPESFLL